jgi:DNA-directed RNA polymerase beta' subunit
LQYKNQIFCGNFEALSELEKMLTKYSYLEKPPFEKIDGVQAIKKLLQDKKLAPDKFIFDTLFVLPPDLRPLISLNNEKFVTSDLNDIYRMLINRNNRLGRLLDLNAPQIILAKERELLQKAIFHLFNNAVCEKPLVAFQNRRPLLSLADEFLFAKESLLESGSAYDQLSN